MAKILVTGALGFLGRTLIKKLCLKCKSDKIIGFDKFLGSSRLKNLSYIQGDILNSKDVFNALKGSDIIIHLVASASPDPKIKKKIIVEGTRTVVNASKKADVKKIVFLSSYSASRKNKDATGEAKLEAEEIIKKSKIEYTFLRPTLIYGKGGRIFNHILNSLKYPVVPIIGDGNNKVGYVHVENIADIVIKTIDKKHSNKTYTIIGEIITYNDFIKTFLEIKNKRKIIIHIPLKLILILVGILHKLRLYKFDKSRVLRAVEDVRYDRHDFRKYIDYRLTSLKQGLKKSI